MSATKKPLVGALLPDKTRGPIPFETEISSIHTVAGSGTEETALLLNPAAPAAVLLGAARGRLQALDVVTQDLLDPPGQREVMFAYEHLIAEAIQLVDRAQTLLARGETA